MCHCLQSPCILSTVQPWEATRTSDCVLECLTVPYTWRALEEVPTVMAHSPDHVSTLSHALCCPLPARRVKSVCKIGGGFGDRALELFVWLSLYYDCLPLYKYYLNIMMRNKNKTKLLKDERGKPITQSFPSRSKRTKQFWVCIIDCSCAHRLAH